MFARWSLLVALQAGLFLAATSPAPATAATGWTTLTASSDTKKIYVAASGNDSNPGTEAAPVKTINKGHSLMRQGKPDWLLLRCGDKWLEDIMWDRGGRSASERAVLTYYGDKTKGRPQMGAFHRLGGSGRQQVSNFAVVGVKFQYDSRDPAKGSGAPTSTKYDVGMRLLDPIQNVLVEDCYFRWWKYNINAEGLGGQMKNVVFRRNIVLDSYYGGSGGTHRPQGIYASRVDGLVIEENCFDHNGWANSTAFGRSQYNHNVYIDANCGNANVVGNVLTNGASHGAQLRSAGTFSRNWVHGNAIAFFIGGSGYKRNYSRAIRNLVSCGTHMTPLRSGESNSYRAWGIEIKSSADGLYDENMVIDVAVTNPGPSLGYSEGSVKPNYTTVRNSRIRSWSGEGGSTSGFTLSNNRTVSGGFGLDAIVLRTSGATQASALIEWHRNRGPGVWSDKHSAGALCDAMWTELKDR